MACPVRHFSFRVQVTSLCAFATGTLLCFSFGAASLRAEQSYPVGPVGTKGVIATAVLPENQRHMKNFRSLKRNGDWTIVLSIRARLRSFPKRNRCLLGIPAHFRVE